MTLQLANSIKLKIVLFAVILLLIGMGIPTVVSFVNTRQAIIDATIKESEQITGITGKNLELWVETRKSDIKKLGADAIFQRSLGDSFLAKSARKKAGEKLSLEVEINPFYLNLSIVDKEGGKIVSSNQDNRDDTKDFNKLIGTALSGKTAISDLSLNTEKDTASFFITSPVSKDNEIVGAISSEIDLGYFADQFINDLKVGKSGFLYLVNKAGKIVIHPSKELINQFDLNETTWGQQILAAKNGIVTYDWQGKTTTDVFVQIPNLGWQVITSVDKNDMTAPAQKTTYLNLGISVILLIFAIALSWFLASKASNPLIRADLIMRQFKDGDFRVRMNFNSGDEIGRVSGSLDSLADDLQSAIKDINNVMGKVASGDLSERVQVDLKGDLNDLKENINKSIDLLEEALSQVISTSDQVNNSAQELASTAQSLADGTTQQAASLEETSSSMSEVESSAKENNQNAIQAVHLTKNMREVVTRVDAQMNEMLESMNQINQTSADISKIIKVIDEIAFQTNLLALNAAVEAARAGKYGKGFAVVAEEVRNLAARSAEAAKNTTTLIENSVKEVEKGVVKADKTAEALKEVNSNVIKVNDMVSQIGAASDEQQKGIEEINNGIGQVNNVVQKNSSISEETASASDELSNQARQLQSIMNQFTISTHLRDQEKTPLLASHVQSQETPMLNMVSNANQKNRC